MRPYSVRVPLRWSDMDAYGHVNNVMFLQLLEDARVRAFRDWFGSGGTGSKGTGGPATEESAEKASGQSTGEGRAAATPARDLLADGVLVARHEIEYLAPLTYAYEDVLTALWCSSVKGASFDIGYEVADLAGREVYVRAETTLVCYDFATGAPRRLRSDEREVLAAVAGDPVPLRRRGA